MQIFADTVGRRPQVALVESDLLLAGLIIEPDEAAAERPRIRAEHLDGPESVNGERVPVFG